MKPESPREGAFFLIRHKLGISTIAEKLIETQSNTYLLFITPLQLEITHKTPQFYALNSTTSESDNATSNTCARTRMHHSAQPRIPFGTDSAHKNRSAVNKYFLLFCNCIPVSILTSDVALRRLDNAYGDSPVESRHRKELIAGDMAILMETLARLTEADIRQVLRILTPPEQETVRRQSQRLARLARVH